MYPDIYVWLDEHGEWCAGNTPPIPLPSAVLRLECDLEPILMDHINEERIQVKS